MQIHEDIRFQELIERIEALHIKNCTEEMQLLLEQLQTLAETEQDDIGLSASYFYRDILSDEEPGSATYMEYAKRALKIAETKNIPYYRMKASNSLGIMYSEISDFHTSLEYYLRALQIADEHPEYHYSSIVLNNVGNLFCWLMDYEDASIYLERAYYAEEQDHATVGDIIILNLIELYSNLENDQKVREWEAISKDMLEGDAKALTDCIILIYEAKRLTKIGHTCEAVSKIREFIKFSHEICDYIYIFHCSTSALRIAIEMGDFRLSSEVFERLEQTQNESSMTCFAYDYVTARVEYYQAFREYLQMDCSHFYQEYYEQSQIRIEQLHNTYAQSLSVKIQYEVVKSENKTVQLQNDMLQKNMELDIFTNLYNKVSTEKHVRIAMQERPDNVMQGLFLVDIDLFKRINDNYGHVFGDEIITQVANTLNTLDKGPQIAGRFGGDEFLLFLKQHTVDEIKEVAEILLSQIRSNIKMPDDRVAELTLSIGICIIDASMDFKEAFELADEALYQAKERGRNQYVMK